MRYLLVLLLLMQTQVLWADSISNKVDEARRAFFKGNPKLAKQLFRECAQEAQTPDELAHVHQVAAGCFAGAEDWNRATSHQKKLIKVREERLQSQVDRTLYGDALLGLARMYRKAGRPAQVEKTYERALEIDNMPKAWLTRVTDEYRLYLEKSGQVEKANELSANED